MGLILLITAPAWALGASALGWPPLRTTLAFTTAPVLWMGGLWLFSRPVPAARRGHHRVLLALGAAAGILPGLAIPALVAGALSVTGAIMGAISGWALMAGQIWEAHILPTDGV